MNTDPLLGVADAHAATRELAELLRRERFALAEFLVALAAFDRARLWVDLGHSGLFVFLHRELRLSKGAAYYRKTAAELLQLHPELVEPLRDGRLCLTSILELAKVITPENRAEILPRFFHQSRQEAQGIVAELKPALAVPTRDVVHVLGRCAAASAPPGLGQAAGGRAAEPASTRASAVSHAPEELPLLAACDDRRSVGSSELVAPRAQAGSDAPRRAPVAAPAPNLCRVHLTLSSRVLQKVEAARDALSGARAAPTTDEVLEAALDLLLAADRKKKALPARPRKRAPARPASLEARRWPRPEGASPRTEDAAADCPQGEAAAAAPRSSRYIPADVRREVWTRDRGRCTWPLADGGECGATRHLQLDHVTPFAAGGPTTTANLRLTCSFHNSLAARRFFGDGWIDAVRRRGTSPPEAEAG